MSSRNVRTSTRSRRRWQNELRAERRIEKGFGIKPAPVPSVLDGLVKPRAPKRQPRTEG